VRPMPVVLCCRLDVGSWHVVVWAVDRGIRFGASPRLHRKILEDDEMEDENCLVIVYLLTVINTHHKPSI
jgi:hypothetical protein